ncbi:endonuclease V, partial [Salmonella sp. SAL4355]|uniref:endonuclease V n=1 Tax=Salmonella sp. SAL4355 TaxID=3159876 RepID=UPI00397CEF87
LYDVPTIGCAKSHYHGAFDPPGAERGACTPLRDGDVQLGSVLRTRSSVKPLWVSPGHRISVSTACAWILRLAPHTRLPETTRAANMEV